MMIDLEQVQNGISRINDVDVRLYLDQPAGYIQQLRLGFQSTLQLSLSADSDFCLHWLLLWQKSLRVLLNISHTFVSSMYGQC